MAHIANILFKPSGVDELPDEYLRVELTEAKLVVGYGLDGDVKGGHPSRQLNIISTTSLDKLRLKGFHTEPGQMGEQLVIDGLEVDSLPIGTRVQLGDEAIVEIGRLREGTERLETVQQRGREHAKGLLGVFARVIMSGNIAVGDRVVLVK